MLASRLRAALIRAFAVVSWLAGPARSESEYSLSDTLAILAPGEDRAALYLMREQFVRSMRPLPPERIFLDNAALGLLPQKSYLAALVKPGIHCITGISPTADMCLELRAGSICFLRLREIIDENDQVVTEWLLDSPGLVGDALKESGVQLVGLTDKGRARLEKRARSPARSPEWEAEHRRMATVAFPFTLEEIWYEDPLDPVSLKHDFQKSRIGNLTVATDTIRFASDRKSLMIPSDRIISVRFGGTRFIGTAPWVDVQYETDSGPRTWSFADSRPISATTTYNRLFMAIETLREARAVAADSSGAGGAR